MHRTHRVGRNISKETMKALLVIALFSFLTINYFLDLKSHTFHMDEFAFIRKSYYFDLFIKRDFMDRRWIWVDSYSQPKVGSYIYGITLHLAGINDIEEALRTRRFNILKHQEEPWWRPWQHKELDNIPPDMLPRFELVWLARKTAVLFTLASLMLLFLLGKKIHGSLFGFLSALMLGLNPLMVLTGRRAMTDSIQLLFFFATLLLTYSYVKALENNNNRKAILLSLALGANAALAVGVKVSGILTVFFLSVLFITILVLHVSKKNLRGTVLASIMLMTGTFIAVMVVLHPYLYINPIERFASMFAERAVHAQRFKSLLPSSAVSTRWEAVKLILTETLLPPGNYMNFKVPLLPIDPILFVVGVGILGQRAAKNLFSRNKISGELILIIWALVVIGSLVFYLQNNWPRFYLPTVAAVTIIQAYAIATLLHALWPRVVKRFRRARPD